jgi:hypothetical protein
MKKMMLLGCVALVACGGQKLDLGGTSADSVGATGDGDDAGSTGGADSAVYNLREGGIPGTMPCAVAPSPSWAIPAGDAGASLAALGGDWSGVMDGEDGGASTPVSLVIEPPDGGPVGATLTFGTPTPIVSNPDEPFSVAPPRDVPFPYSGFSYTATRLSFDGKDLSFTTALFEIYKLWCTEQASYSWAPNFPGGCGCAPDWPMQATMPGVYVITNPTTGAKETVSGSTSVYGECNEPGNEGPPCFCSSAGCTVDMSGNDGAAQLTWTAGKLDGTFTVTPYQSTTSSTLSMHLTRH